MQINGKPISEMSYEEMVEWTERLRAGREALREAAIAKKRETGRVPPTPRRTPVPKEKSVAEQAAAEAAKDLFND